MPIFMPCNSARLRLPLPVDAQGMGTSPTLKRALQSGRMRALLCWVGAWFIRLVWHSGRWTVRGGDGPERFWRDGKPFILCFWHGRLLMMPYCWTSKAPINMLISHHRDGQIIARTVGHFGIATLGGSTSHGGSAALRDMLKALKAGEYVGVTPDGPHGPRMRASAGIVNLAKLAGIPILPATFSASRRRLLGSWDRFVLVWPFTRGVIAWGEPISVARDADDGALEEARLKVENSLNTLSREADLLCGQAPVEPDP